MTTSRFVQRDTVARVSTTTSRGADSTSSYDRDRGLAPASVIVAGGGIGGLVLAIGLLKQNISVKVLERDLTAIRGEGKYRGPIQVQSNALAA